MTVHIVNQRNHCWLRHKPWLTVFLRVGKIVALWRHNRRYGKVWGIIITVNHYLFARYYISLIFASKFARKFIVSRNFVPTLLWDLLSKYECPCALITRGMCLNHKRHVPISYKVCAPIARGVHPYHTRCEPLSHEVWACITQGLCLYRTRCEPVSYKECACITRVVCLYHTSSVPVSHE